MSAIANSGLLLVDDDPSVIAAFRRVAHRLATRLRVARSADAAWAELHEAPPGLVIAEYDLPGDENGLALLERIAGPHPKVLRILHTARSIRGAPGVDIPVLAKPCEDAVLEELLRTLLLPGGQPAA